MRIVLAVSILLASCQATRKMHWPERKTGLRGSEFYRLAAAMNWQARDSFVLREVLEGNIPGFMREFVPVQLSMTNPVNGSAVKALVWVSPDYLSVGNNEDWARINITPRAAQRIADSFHCFLPTRKIVDAVYAAATVKLEPVPMYAFRDSTATMWQHHLIIEGQRKGRKGLIAGIKKDVVISGKVTRDPKPDRVAIYGWHKPDGKPIQPLYTGHVYWWVDYSQGIRLVYRKIKINGNWMDYTEVLKHPVYRGLLCDEEYCDFTRYD